MLNLIGPLPTPSREDMVADAADHAVHQRFLAIKATHSIWLQ